MAEFPDNTLLDRLAERDVRYVLLEVAAIPTHKQAPADGLSPTVFARISMQPQLELVDTFDHIQVYRLHP